MAACQFKAHNSVSKPCHTTELGIVDAACWSQNWLTVAKMLVLALKSLYLYRSVSIHNIYI